ncbi:60S ribosomal protein L4-1 [Platanthera guangdongensis]|uniref:60S ribosomal protein L4-1 n=1 Tax=Platanthera guangdongensis TaxID=2320717 RepID=A0ABR2MNQ0_9ASPA
MAKRVEVTSDAWGDSLPLLIGSGDVQRRKKNKKQSEGSMVWMALEEATEIKAAGRAWYKTMISDSEYTEFENFSKWLGATQ